MKILLINTPSGDYPVARDMAGGLGFDGGNAIVLPPLELAYFAATLSKRGHEVKIIDAQAERLLAEDALAAAQAYRPEAVIATVSLPTIHSDCVFIKRLRRCVSGRLIANTAIAHPPLLEEILKTSQTDLVIYGECELVIDEVISGREKKGTAYLAGGGAVIEEKSVIKDLDELPLPARELLPNERYRYPLLGSAVTTMQTSRGCPFPCSYYCPYPLVQGKPWRPRSPEHVAAEIEDIVRNHRISKILFRDASFTLDRARAVRICELMLEKRLGVRWWCETRVDCLDSGLMSAMKRGGCKGMNIGVETGDPAVMQTQAKIGMTLEKLKRVRDDAKRLGLELHFLLLIGLPDETRESLYMTYRLLRELDPETVGVCVVTPYPGTPLYEEAKKKGWMETEDWTRFGGHFPVMHTDNLSMADLTAAQHMINEWYLTRHAHPLKGWIGMKLLDRCFRRWASRR